MQIFRPLKRAAWLGTVIFLSAPMTYAERPRCGEHGGMADCDSKSKHVVCKDGTLDLRYTCTASTYTLHEPVTRVLKFKSETANGQIVSPGEQPPTTTLESSSSPTVTNQAH